MADSRRILEGPLARELARFGTPLALGMALQTTFNLVDAYLVAHLPKAEVGPAIGALGLCDQITAFGTIVSYGVSTATSALLSRHKGAGDQASVRRTAWQSMLLVAALSVLFGVVGLTLAGPIVRGAVGAKGDVAAVATSYLRVMMGGSATIFFLLQVTTIQRALGSAKTPAAILVGGNLLNIVLAIVLIYGPGPAPAYFAWGGAIARALGVPKMGMLGAAWATIIARAAALVPAFVVTFRRFGVLAPERGERRPDVAELKAIAHLAWPSSTQFVLRILGMLLINSLVARFFTTATDQTATTAMGLVFRLDTMALFVAMGWGSAAQTFVGQNLGAKREARATRSGWIVAVYDAFTNLGLIALLFAYGEPILAVFDSDPAPLGIAMTYLHAVVPSYVALGAGVVLGNAMAGAGATKLTMWVDAAVILGFLFPTCIGAALLGATEVTLFRIVAATNAVSAVAYAVVYARGGWRKALAAPAPAAVTPDHH